MDEGNRRGIERSLHLMHDKLGEDLTVDDMARSAMFSKFHYSRTFRRATGISPGRFLSAIRLAAAKRLLLTTQRSVADISHEVGYNSVGTFSTRFSNSVGCSPSAYRRSGGRTPAVPVAGGAEIVSSVRGHVSVDPSSGPVFVGLFPTPIAEGAPAAHTFLTGSGTFALQAPAGTWYAVASAPGTAAEPLVGFAGPVTVGPGMAALVSDIRLRPRVRFDPPILLALPDPVALQAVAA